MDSFHLTEEGTGSLLLRRPSPPPLLPICSSSSSSSLYPYPALLFTLSHSSTSYSSAENAALPSGGVVGITSLSFRTDGAAARYGIAPLAVGRTDGCVSVWDLTPKYEDGGDGGAGYGYSDEEEGVVT